MNNRQLNFLCNIIITLGGALTLLSGIIVILGWYLQIPLIIEIKPQMPVMQFNTAIGFVATGLGILFFRSSIVSLKKVIGIFLMFWGGIVLIVDITGMDLYIEKHIPLLLGVDTLFFEKLGAAHTHFPGRMAPTAALCFFLAGVAIYISSVKELKDHYTAALSLIGSIILALGVVAIIGYIARVPIDYGVFIAPMALHTAIAFVFTGIAILTYAIQARMREHSSLSLWMILAICILCITFTWGISQAILSQWQSQTTQSIVNESEEISKIIKREIDLGGQSLQRIAHRFSKVSNLTQESWQRDSRLFINDFPGFDAIAYADSSMHIKWVSPKKYQSKLLDLNLSTIGFPTPQKTTINQSVSYAEFPLYSKGEKQPIVYVPLTINDTDPGTLLVVLNFEKMFAELLTNVIDPNYLFTISLNGKELFNSKKNLKDYNLNWCQEGTIKVGGITLDTYTFINTDLSNSSLFLLLKIFAFEGFLLALILAIVIYLVQQTRMRLKQVQKINQDLQLAIEKRDKVSTALQESEIRNKAILDTAVYGILTIDERGKINTLNPSTTEMFGYAEDEIIGQNFKTLLNDTSGSQFDDLVRKYLLGQSLLSAYRSRDLQGKRKTGTTFPIEIAISKISLEGLQFYTLIVCDISEQVHAERVLIESRKEMEQAKNVAEAANKSKGAFLASMSHEIRTPMNTIIGMADLLGETQINEEQNQYVELLKSAGEHLLNLINDILDFSKLDSGLLRLHCTDFSLRNLLEKTCEAMAVIARKKNLELVTEVEEDLPDGLHGDPLRIRQILTNLISNAIKFSHKGSIRVRVHHDPENGEPGALLFSVKDSGMGIPLEKHRYVFERFYQADTSSTRRQGGAGLGLSICKNLVEMMGGKIWFNSRENYGSTFYFSVLLLESKNHKTIEKEPVTISNLKGFRILAIDDNENNRSILQKHLSEWGASVTLADDGTQGLAFIEESLKNQTPYHLVILDSRMPYMDGFEVAREIKRINSLETLPLMMMFTSDSHASDIEQADEIGFSCYLIKPIKVDELHDTIFEALNRFLKDNKGKNVLSRVAEELTKTEPLITVPKRPEKNMQIKKVLVVEDSPENLLLLQFYLKKQPYEIDHAEDGEVAVQKFKEFTYDIVLMDLQMPIMDGYTATKIIREWEAQNNLAPTPIIALTAYVLPAELQKALDAGCTYYLTKPIKKETLLDTLQQFSSLSESEKNEYKLGIINIPEKETLVIEHALKEIVPQYLTNIKSNLQEILDAIAQDDLKKAITYGHQMKGSGEGYGIPKITELGALIEMEARNDNIRGAKKYTKELLNYLNNLEIIYI